MNQISLTRYYTPHATWGDLYLPDGFACKTLELPWLQNQVRISCIPEGEYTLRKRRSGVVERSSGGEFLDGWEVTGVDGRTWIMIHPGNWTTDILGCIAVGESHAILRNAKTSAHQMAVNKSRATFRVLMAALSERDTWQLNIQQYHPEPAL
jgi:hypothetical protein